MTDLFSIPILGVLLGFLSPIMALLLTLLGI